MNPTRAELEMFAIGGHDAERLAVLAYAGRVGLDPGTARRRLREILAAPLPAAWQQVARA